MFENLSLSDVLLTFGPLIAVAYVLGGIGQAFTRAIFPRGWPRTAGGLKGWRYWFRVTYGFHPIMAGFVVGWTLPLPVPEFMGPHLWGRIIWFMIAGLCAVPVHQAITHKLDTLDDDELGNI